MNAAPSTANACPSPSAFRMATARALHQLLDEPRVLPDDYALGCLGPETAATLLLDPDAHNDVAGRSLRAGVVARSRFAEDRLLRAVAVGVRQYTVVGAGLDTWALRTARTLPAIEVFELDRPDMQAWKQRTCAGNGWELPSRLHSVPVDLRASTIVDALDHGGADLSVPMVVSILGVLVYLDQRAVERTLDTLRALPTGSTLVLDYRLDEELLPPIERSMMQFTARVMAAGGEPWLSASAPERMQSLLATAGFHVEEDVGPAELNARYFARRRDGLQIAGGGFRYLSAARTR